MTTYIETVPDYKQYPITSIIPKPSGKGVVPGMFQLRDTCINQFEVVVDDEIHEFMYESEYTVSNLVLKETNPVSRQHTYTLTVCGYDGFQYDMASVPRVAWTIIHPCTPQAQRAALVHDILYTLRTPRWLADLVFSAILKEDGMNAARREAAYAAVRSGGWYYYLKNPKGERL